MVIVDFLFEKIVRGEEWGLLDFDGDFLIFFFFFFNMVVYVVAITFAIEVLLFLPE